MRATMSKGCWLARSSQTPRVCRCRAFPADFSFDLLGEDWDHFMPMMENALRRIPALESRGGSNAAERARKFHARQPIHA